MAYILSELKAEVPSWLKFWIPDRSGEAVKQLDKIFIRVQNKHRVPSWDLPHLDKMKEALSVYNISSFRDLNNKILKPVDCMVEHDIPEMIAILYDTESGLRDNKQEASESGSYGSTLSDYQSAIDNESVSSAHYTRLRMTPATKHRKKSYIREKKKKTKLRRTMSWFASWLACCTRHRGNFD